MKVTRLSGSVLGLVLSLGAPLGWAMLSAVLYDSKWALYLYLLVSTGIVFGSFGYWSGYLYEKQELLANTDKLTGLDNRRSFLEKSEKLMRYCQRKGQPVTMVYLDLDNFKNLNDVHGHNAGDLALVRFARLLQKCLRDSDLVCRLGGDEFALLLPGTDQEQSAHVVKRIRAGFEREIRENTKFSQLNVSVGVQEAPSKNTNLDVILKMADERMYLEKKAKQRLSRG